MEHRRVGDLRDAQNTGKHNDEAHHISVLRRKATNLCNCSGIEFPSKVRVDDSGFIMSTRTLPPVLQTPASRAHRQVVAGWSRYDLARQQAMAMPAINKMIEHVGYSDR